MADPTVKNIANHLTPKLKNPAQEAVNKTIPKLKNESENSVNTLKLQTQGLTKQAANALCNNEVIQGIVSPRDVASGQATGKRQHKPF